MSSGMMSNILEQPGVVGRLAEKYLGGSGAALAPLREKQQLYLVGTGASLNAALASVTAFARFAGRAPVVLPASEIACYTSLFDENSAVVLVSQSGDSFETKQMCALMRARGLPFWGITNEAGSTLAREATYPLLMEAGAEVSSATKTHAATLFLLYALAAGEDAAARDALAKMPACVEKTLEDCRPVADGIARQFLLVSQMYVLADNVNGATARQGALMIKEKARIHAEGMTASEFRHGAVEVVRPGQAILYIAASAENSGETAAHLEYLNRQGCHITLISAGGGYGLTGEAWFPVAAPGEDVFSQLPATLPLQLLAESIARQKGYDVDGFRYISKVVAGYDNP